MGSFNYYDDLAKVKKIEKRLMNEQLKRESDERKEEMQIYRTMDKLNKVRRDLNQKEPYLTDYYIPVKTKAGVKTCRVTNIHGVGISRATLKILSDLQSKLNDGICRYRKKKNLKVNYMQI